MTGREVVADTYALIGIVRGETAYAQHQHTPLTTSVFNLAELYYILLRDDGEQKAHECLQVFANRLAPIDNAIIRRAMKMRLSHKKERLSYADCIGYALAAHLNIPFLTGDKQFEGKPNVLFVR